MTLTSTLAAPAAPPALDALDAELVHLETSTATVEVRHGAQLIAVSSRVIELHEVDVPVRYYVPRGDVRLDLLRPIDVTSFCPFKGVASDYWALADDDTDTPVAWSYPQPIGAFGAIAGAIAFYDSLDLRVLR